MVRQRFSAYGFQPPLPRRAFLVLAAVMLGIVAVVIAVASSGVLPENVAATLSRVVGLTNSTGALLAWVWSARRHATRRHWRRWMACAMALYLSGTALWAIGQILAGHRLGIELGASATYLVAAFFTITAVLLHNYDHDEARSPLRSTSSLVMPVLDLLIMVVSMLLFVLVALVRPWERTSGTSVPFLASVLLQPLTYLLVVATIVFLARFRPEARDLPIALLALGASAFVGTSTAFAHTVEVEMITIPPWMESWFNACPAFFLLAALAPTTREEAPSVQIRANTREIALLSIPYLPLLTSVAVAVPTTITETRMPAAQANTFLLLLILVIVRQLATLAENLRLLRQAEHEAIHDPLTGLANRTLFLGELDRTLRHRTKPLILVFCDMDDFKEINDSYGHVVGDEVLMRTARRLQRCATSEDTVARMGGDEFALLLRDPHESLTDIEQRLLETLQEPHALRGEPRVVSASVGVTSLPAGVAVSGSDELMNLADTAMYAAKQRGKNTLTYLPEARS